MKFFEFSNKVKTICGVASLQHLSKELWLNNMKNILIISDKNLQELGYVEKIKEIVTSEVNKCAVVTYININNYAMDINVQEAYTIFRQNGCDSILACGGASVVDTAKYLRLLLVCGVENLENYGKLLFATKSRKIPFGVISTTGGGGVEINARAFVRNSANHNEKYVENGSMQPNFCIVDPYFSHTLDDKKIMLDSCKAMVNSIESYMGIYSNSITQPYSLMSLQILAKNLIEFEEGNKSDYIRLALQEGAILSGIASPSGIIGLSYSIANAIVGIKSDLIKEEIVLLILPNFLQFMKPYVNQKYEEMLVCIMNNYNYSRIEKQERGQLFIDIIALNIANLSNKYNIKRRLVDYGIEENDYSIIAENVCNDTSIFAYSIPIEKQNIVDILKMC